VTSLERDLAAGALRVLGHLAGASNGAVLCEVQAATGPVRCVVKPRAGERPLWDFPGAVLGRREVLTARVAACFGWRTLIPTTVWRDDGPLGPGMCQEWVDAAPEGPPVGLFRVGSVPEGWRTVAEGTSAGDRVQLAHEQSADLQRVVVLDAVANNADRKGGHVLRRVDGSLAAIDHGVTWHPEAKLRTVLWGWAGEPVPDWLLDELEAGACALRRLLARSQVDAELTADEVAAADQRLTWLLAQRTFPVPGPDRPPLPWPPM
jgi:uncharacterized repeat protein (TIGR03843 family)